MSRGRVVLALGAFLALAACGTPGTGAPATVVYRFGVVGSQGKYAQLERTTPTVVGGISGRIVQIATSNSDGYALTSGGAVFSWGVDNDGELGNGTTAVAAVRAVQVDFPTGVRITALANPMPFDGALALDARGHAWGWGLDADGDLCLPGGVEPRPVRLALDDVTLATGARTHALFDAGGKEYACGDGQGGVLGDGSTADASTPTAVVGLPGSVGVIALTSSWEGSGALLADGAYYDWGYNAAGQLGDHNTTDSDVPVPVELPGSVRQVSQGGSGATNGQTIAVLTDGTVWAWGDNTRGQLGDDSVVSSDVPVRVEVPAGVTFVSVDSGGYSCYAIDRSGRLWAWGGDRNGQLGTGGGNRSVTRPAALSIHLTQVSSTASNVAGLAG